MPVASPPGQQRGADGFAVGFCGDRRTRPLDERKRGLRLTIPGAQCSMAHVLVRRAVEPRAAAPRHVAHFAPAVSCVLIIAFVECTSTLGDDVAAAS